MSHVIDVLPPPDLSYPSDRLEPDRPIVTWGMSYERTKLAEESPPTKSGDSSGDLASFLAIVDRFIPKQGSHRVCIMCRYV